MVTSINALDKGYCAIVEITSINPSSVGADEDFTVGIQIDNCGDKLPENIIFEITSYSKDIEIKEPLINYVGKMGYANSKRFITYHMHSSPDAIPGEHVFETKLTYGGEDFFIEKENTFSITINTQEPDLTISRIYTTPEIIYAGEKIILTIDIENAGNGEAKDVRVEIENLNLEGVKQKYLGKIKSDENLPARFVFETNEKGIFEGNIKLNYKFGGEIKELNFPLQIQIFSKGINKFLVVAIILILGVLGYFLFGKELNSKK
ncbi:hypothetical protein KAT80_02705 [Candidatus Pacearchaeota archaeon]|nr:hypothetical protein [Candidatus Pacearchaeota archaeon]